MRAIRIGFLDQVLSNGNSRNKSDKQGGNGKLEKTIPLQAHSNGNSMNLTGLGPKEKDERSIFVNRQRLYNGKNGLPVVQRDPFTVVLLYLGE